MEMKGGSEGWKPLQGDGRRGMQRIYAKTARGRKTDQSIGERGGGGGGEV